MLVRTMVAKSFSYQAHLMSHSNIPVVLHTVHTHTHTHIEVICLMSRLTDRDGRKYNYSIVVFKLE